MCCKKHMRSWSCHACSRPYEEERGCRMVTPNVKQSHRPLETVMACLKGVRKSLRGWVACCPAHRDREPSLSIGLGDEGQILLKCFAGCSLDRIVEAMGISVADLFPCTPSASVSQTESTHCNVLSLV